MKLTRLLPLILLRSFGSAGGDPAVLDGGTDNMELSSESDSDILMPSCCGRCCWFATSGTLVQGTSLIGSGWWKEQQVWFPPSKTPSCCCSCSYIDCSSEYTRTGAESSGGYQEPRGMGWAEVSGVLLHISTQEAPPKEGAEQAAGAEHAASRRSGRCNMMLVQVQMHRGERDDQRRNPGVCTYL